MVCPNCGSGSGVDAYTVRFTLGEREPTAMELERCEACVGDFREEPGIEVH